MPHADCGSLKESGLWLLLKEVNDIVWNAAVEVEKHITAAIVACIKKRCILSIFDGIRGTAVGSI